ncbi:transcription factor bHLH18-like [Chenopodium quinoa]|uniref:BHLH domain-containing protein n=1 Tax=Chenopodium quinoa TaxID=63459 RepID=A0A803L1Y7_CHEQI|nr:transcription factor bHLH18-like [Chenopodium quinoa]
METDPNNPSLINNPYQQSETMEPSFEEQLAATLGNDFPYYPIFATTVPAFPEGNIHQSPRENKKETTMKQAVSSAGAKRKRRPSQVQDHIMAERKRRQLLRHMFISLSAILPGLKKIDKTTVLGEAIKHMKELQEKVKVLESVIAKRTMESVVAVVKKSKLIIDNGSSDDNVSSSTVDDYCGNGDDSFPEIQVKVMGKTLLLRVLCEKQKGILAKLFAEIDNQDLTITNFSVVPFESLALHVTIVAQMESGFNKNVRDLVRILGNAIASKWLISNCMR